MTKFVVFIINIPILFQKLDIYLYSSGISPVPSVSLLISISLLFLIICLKKIKLLFFRPLLFFYLILFIISLLNVFFLNEFPFFNIFIKSSINLLILISYLFFCISIYNSNKINKSNLIKITLALSLIPIFGGFVQYLCYNIFDYENNLLLFLFNKPRAYYSDIIRLSSIFNEPSWFGYYLLLIFILARYFNFENTKIKSFFIFSISFMIILTGSFSVYFIFASFLFFQFFLEKKYFLMFSLISLSILTMIILYQNPLVQEIVSRIYALINLKDAGGSVVRIDTFFANIKLWLSSPTLGTGYGLSSHFISDYIQNKYSLMQIASGNKISSDSVFTLILSELGAVGFIAFIYFFFKTGNTHRNFNNSEKFLSLYLGILIFFYFLTSGFLTNPLIWLVFLIRISLNFKEIHLT